MKLVREHINEKFTDDSDPIEDMGIGPRHVIIQWFKEMNIHDRDYEIDENLNINFKTNLDFEFNPKLTSLPDNLSVDGFLDIRGTGITKLPKNLRIRGDSYMAKTQITELPSDLYIGGDYFLEFSKITKLADNLDIMGYLDIENTPIKKLPKNLQIETHLFIRHTSIKTLPLDIKIGGRLYCDNEFKNNNKKMIQARGIICSV